MCYITFINIESKFMALILDITFIVYGESDTTVCKYGKHQGERPGLKFVPPGLNI
jgi:hypothetical protein